MSPKSEVNIDSHSVTKNRTVIPVGVPIASFPNAGGTPQLFQQNLSETATAAGMSVIREFHSYCRPKGSRKFNTDARMWRDGAFAFTSKTQTIFTPHLDYVIHEENDSWADFADTSEMIHDTDKDYFACIGTVSVSVDAVNSRSYDLNSLITWFMRRTTLEVRGYPEISILIPPRGIRATVGVISEHSALGFSLGSSGTPSDGSSIVSGNVGYSTGKNANSPNASLGFTAVLLARVPEGTPGAKLLDFTPPAPEPEQEEEVEPYINGLDSGMKLNAVTAN